MVEPACSKRRRRKEGVANVVPLPGGAKPKASVRECMEHGVNIPEAVPQVGQAEPSTVATPASSTSSRADAVMAVIRSVGALATPATTTALPASIGPPETKMVGMFKRKAALSMPGVILSQLEIQTSASAVCALTMYSTASEMISRDGRE